VPAYELSGACDQEERRDRDASGEIGDVARDGVHEILLSEGVQVRRYLKVYESD
jgi:hypothetical protein